MTLTKGFYLGKYEVTQAQWKKVMGTSPSNFFGENRPVEQVNWPEVMRFCQELTLTERKAGRLPDGWEYTLPTESEWEYACRARTTTAYSWGNSIAPSNANYDQSGINQTRDVGQYAANPWGFFDMQGNVWEWTAGRYQAAYPTGNVTDPTGPASGSNRVMRGGAWDATGTSMRSAKRNGCEDGHRSSTLGFRVALRQVGK